MYKFLLLSATIVCLVCSKLRAQESTISGTILSAFDKAPLPGASVLIKGTQRGTSSNPKGEFSISAQKGEILVVSFIGYRPQELTLANESKVIISLLEDASVLNEVVVTALGVSREKKALGYNIQEIKGSELTQARPTNLINALSGKIAGVQVTNSNGQPGASSRIMIRGANSIGNNNQPLFVVDGIPIDNGSYNTAPSASATNTNNTTVDYGNGAGAINPDDIEAMTVLKGANAAALYGSRAANGVILITTKSGKGSKGLGISVNSNVTLERPFRLPNYQNEYGQGFKGQFAYVDGRGGGTNDGVDESWGPKLDGRLIAQYNSPIDATGARTPTPWIARPDNVQNFHETGVTTTNNVAITGGNDKGDFRLSYTNLQQKGMYPNTNYKRTTLALNAGYNLAKNLTARASANYIRDGSDNRQNLNLYWTWFGRQVDLGDLKNYEDFNDPTQWPVQRNWNSNYWNNPYFALNRLLYGNDKDRVVGNVQITYKPAEWLTIMGRTGTDFGLDRRATKRARAVGLVNGEFAIDNIFTRESNTDFLVTADKKFKDFQATINVGGNRRYSFFQRDYLQAPELKIPNLYNLANSSTRPNVYNRTTEKAVNSIYGSAAFSFRDYAFLDVTARNDWSSTLQAGSRSYFYPSVSGSAVITDMFGVQSKALSYLKVRAGWAQVGNDTDAYAIQQVYQAEPAWGAVTTFSENNLIYNQDLKPEITTAIEAGIEARLFRNLINVELTYYDKSTANQILRANVPQSSGYSSKIINAGKIRNSGWEVELSASPIKTKNFRWDINVNYARNRSEVIDLGGLTNYQINTGALLRNVILEARPGSPYGNFYGTYYRRAPDGQLIIDAKGYPTMSSDRKVLGNIMPIWTGGLQNTFTYKGVSLSTLVDVRTGGQLFAHSVNIGRYTGVLAETLPGREGGIVAPGVTETKNTDGTFSYAPNTTVVALPEDYYHNFYNRNNNEAYMFDASYVKLREARLSFNLPNNWFGRTPFKGVVLSVVGRNLLLLYSQVPHIDPETSFYGDGNVQGFENGNLPSARSIGFNLNFGL